MAELKFASENEALQYLADVTGKKVKIAEIASPKELIKNFFQGEHIALYPGLMDYMVQNISGVDKTGDAESWSISFKTKLPKKFKDTKTTQQKEINIDEEEDLRGLIESSGSFGGPGSSFDRGVRISDIQETSDEWIFEVSSSGGLDI